MDFSAAGDGRIIEGFGDIRTASNIAIMVEGQGQSLHNQSARPKAKDIRDEANKIGPGSTATIAWLGYDSSDHIVDSLFGDKAAAGGDSLKSFVDGLRDASPSARMVAVGQSYGTVAVGFALAGGMDVDDAVVTGSPGLGNNSVGKIGRIYYATAPGDSVSDCFGPLCKLHGPDPATADQARQLDVGNATTHNHYYSGTSLTSIASVVTGSVRQTPEGLWGAP